MTHSVPLDNVVIDNIRQEANRILEPLRKAALGQFMTPSSIARFMASLFSPVKGQISLLDAGAGVGSLTSAFLDRYAGKSIHVDAWEVDPALCEYLKNTLSGYADRYADVGYAIHDEDFIDSAVWNLGMNTGARFTHAILNPPYKKINSNGRHRLLLRQVDIETVNLYSAFLALAILLMKQGGEVVAIVPRSFCNGTYYRPFRELLLKHCAIRHIHVFEARDKAFAEDGVLQENIVIKLERSGAINDIVVSHCIDAGLSDYRAHCFPFSRIVKPDDSDLFIHVPSTAHDDMVSSFTCTLGDIGLEVCTGPVVDFRLREHCHPTLVPGTVPLLYAHHFAQGCLTFPFAHKKKPDAIDDNEQTRKWLMPRGNYVLTKRFSAKEERRRVVAFVVESHALSYPRIGFENHLNVFHVGKKGMDMEMARGLALFLNSTLVDTCFRSFSGHTQVNATDLRQMRYPSRDQLRRFGIWVGDRRLQQAEIDAYIKSME